MMTLGNNPPVTDITRLQRQVNAVREAEANSDLQQVYDCIEERCPEIVDAKKKFDEWCLENARTIFFSREPSSWFITKDGKPTERLVELLSLDGLYDPNDGLSEIVAKTQKSWVMVQQGRDGKERTDLQNTSGQEKIKTLVEKIARDIGLFEARPPLLKHYDYGVCYGVFLDGVRTRLSEFVEAWNNGVRFKSLVFLTGERYLRKEEGQQDSLSLLTDPTKSSIKFKENWSLKDGTPYETEYDLCKIVWEQSEIPEDMRIALEGKVVFVNAPRPDGQQRPGTKDTYYTWLKDEKPASGTILAFSYPILWPYQHIAAENCLNENYPLDTCAAALSPELRAANQERLVSLVQDTVAKCLFELSQRQNTAKIE